MAISYLASDGICTPPSMTDYSALQWVVSSLRYKPGWSFRLVHGPSMNYGVTGTIADATGCVTSAGSPAFFAQSGETVLLAITLTSPDSDEPRRMISVTHHLTVPPYEVMPWKRWVLEQILLVERHEACEFYQIGGDRPFYPDHGPGANPYQLRERT